MLSTKRRQSLAAYAELGNVTHAAKAAKVPRRSHCNWMADPEYAQQFREAMEITGDVLKAEARRRAVEGWDEPVYYGGRIVGHRRRYSGTMLAMLLNGNLPHKYRNRVEHSGPGGGPVKSELQLTNGMLIIENENWHGNANRLKNASQQTTTSH